MSVKILLDKWENKDGECVASKETFIISDTTQNLVDCIQNHLGGDHFLSFNDYYTNANKLLYDRVFPYIIRNGELIWNASFGTVTVDEFLHTHNISNNGEIIVEVDQYGGGGDLLFGGVVSFLVVAIKYKNFAKWLRKGFVFVDKYFIGEDKRVIDLYDVIDFIQTKIQWEIDELIGTTKCKNREFLEMLLFEAGYHCIDGHYVFDNKIWEDLLNGISDREDPWEVDYILYTYESMASELAIINRCVSAVKYLSDPAAIKCYNDVRHLADKLRYRWPDVICRGTQLKYLRIRKNVKPVDENMQALIQRDVEEASANTQNLIAEYYDSKKVNDGFNPPHAG